MLKTVFVLPTGVVAAFDEDGQQVAKAQGNVIDFYYQFMREQGLAGPDTEFNWTNDHGLQQKHGRDFDAIWRPPEETAEGSPG